MHSLIKVLMYGIFKGFFFFYRKLYFNLTTLIIETAIHFFLVTASITFVQDIDNAVNSYNCKK